MPRRWVAASSPRRHWAKRRASPSAATGSECTAAPRGGKSSTTFTCTSSPAAGAAVPSHLIDYKLFGDQFSTPEMRVVFDERTMLQRWLDVEAALAAAQEELGLIPPGTAEAIARAAKVETLDLDAVGRDLAVTAHPIVPLVRELARRAGDAGRWVHWGATTQDIMDTGMVLQLRAAHAILRRDLVALVLALADLAESHRDTVMAGRTHAPQALPITFGFKGATRTAECVRQGERLAEPAPRRLLREPGRAVRTLPRLRPPSEAGHRQT